MKILDLYCGAGGAATGLKNAGLTNIVGVDINDQPDYPFEFHKKNVFDLSPHFFRGFDLIWASPPCQLYSFGSIQHIRKGKKYPDLVAPTRELLLKSGKPFVIENVPRAPIRKDLLLCGEMFKIRVIRHRHFEIEGFKVPQPEHIKHAGMVKDKYYVSCAGHGGHGSNKLSVWQDAMQIHWTQNKHSIAEAVPPKYSEYIGRWYLIHLKQVFDNFVNPLKVFV